MITSSLILKPPEEITSLEVQCYWEQLKERVWAPGYMVYRSPNKKLKAIVNDATGRIGLMWDTYTGQVHQNHPEALLDLIKPLTIDQEKEEAFAAMVDVTPRTVERWLAKGIQSCNVNAEKIIELAMRLNPEEAKRILYEDFARHREQLAAIITEATRQGDVVSGEETHAETTGIQQAG